MEGEIEQVADSLSKWKENSVRERSGYGLWLSGKNRSFWIVCMAVCFLGCFQRTLPPPASVPNPVITGPVLKTPVANPWKPKAKERNWKYIVIHHTASERGNVAEIDKQHKQRKDNNGKPWLGIGYHFLIGNGKGMEDGAIEPTFRWKTQIQGAHAGSKDPVYNQLGVGICLVGNFQKNRPTAKQMASVKKLVNSLKKAYGIRAESVLGHQDVKATECPGELFPMEEVAFDEFDYSLGLVSGDGSVTELKKGAGSP